MAGDGLAGPGQDFAGFEFADQAGEGFRSGSDGGGHILLADCDLNHFLLPVLFLEKPEQAGFDIMSGLLDQALGEIALLAHQHGDEVIPEGRCGEQNMDFIAGEDDEFAGDQGCGGDGVVFPLKQDHFGKDFTRLDDFDDNLAAVGSGFVELDGAAAEEVDGAAGVPLTEEECAFLEVLQGSDGCELLEALEGQILEEVALCQ